jgi:hypothetical protein
MFMPYSLEETRYTSGKQWKDPKTKMAVGIE